MMTHNKSFINFACFTCAVGNLVACVSERPPAPLHGGTSPTLLGTIVVGDILELTEVRLFRLKEGQDFMELKSKNISWSPECVVILSDGLELERAVDGNVLIQRGHSPQPQVFVIKGTSASAFGLPGNFRIENEMLNNPPTSGLIFQPDSGWTCVIAVAPAKVLEWKPSSKTRGEFRIQCEPTKDILFVVTIDKNEATAKTLAKEAIHNPDVVFKKAKEFWGQFFQKEVPSEPLRETKYGDLYKMCWYVLRSNRMAYGQAPLEKGFTCPSKFTYRHQWLWDSVFATIGLRWLHDKTLAIEEFENLLAHPKSDGMLPHEMFCIPFFGKVFGWDDKEGMSSVAAPPVFGMGIEKVFERTNDKKWLSRTYPAVKKYVEWFFRTLDSDKDNLVAIRHTHESSWDNSPRWDEAMKEGRRLIPPVETVDTNCLLVCELQRLARWARMFGKNEDADEFDRKANQTIDAIRKVFWDKEDKFFYDVDETNHKKVRVKTPAGFFPLLNGIATPEQEKSLLVHLTNPEEFWTKYPVPTVAKNEPKFTSKDMWRGPTWANINWVVIEGLRQCGYNDLAKELATRTLDMMLSQGRPEVREWYDPDTGEPCGALNYGWSAGVGVDLMMGILSDNRVEK